MKKRMLSALLALCMVLTMAPAAFAADELEQFFKLCGDLARYNPGDEQKILNMARTMMGGLAA